jgi:hypothetical protein
MPASPKAGQGRYALMGHQPNPGMAPRPPMTLPSRSHLRSPARACLTDSAGWCNLYVVSWRGACSMLHEHSCCKSSPHNLWFTELHILKAAQLVHVIGQTSGLLAQVHCQPRVHLISHLREASRAACAAHAAGQLTRWWTCCSGPPHRCGTRLWKPALVLLQLPAPATSHPTDVRKTASVQQGSKDSGLDQRWHSCSKHQRDLGSTQPMDHGHHV